MYLYSYNQGSKGAENLAREMGIQRIKHRNSKFVGGPNKRVINWGSSVIPDQVAICNVINNHEVVGRCANKLTFFSYLTMNDASHCIVPWSSSLVFVHQSLGDGSTWMARTILSGHSGNGLVIMDPEDPDTWDVNAQLYTKYIKKSDEFRLHLMFNQETGVYEIVSQQRKGLASEFRGRDDINWKVRNLSNGFIYARNNIQLPNVVEEVAQIAIRTMGLHFGAVDVVFNRSSGQAYVLEINTAPGITGTTVTEYAEAFQRIYGAN